METKAKNNSLLCWNVNNLIWVMACLLLLPFAAWMPTRAWAADIGFMAARIRLQGREDHSGALVNVGGWQQVTGGDGRVAFDLPPGYYAIRVSMNGYLYAQETFHMTPGGYIDLCTVTLVGGDVNNDGVIDILDLSYVGGAFGSTNPGADINDDGIVDILDLATVAGNFGKRAPSPWSSGWVFPVGDPHSGAGWYVTISLGETWVHEDGTWYRGHLGEDWFRVRGPTLGEPVYAAAAGDVVILRPNCGSYNDIVVIKHFVRDMTEPIYSFYAHLDAEEFVEEGESVKKGQQIGVIDDPVRYRPHLHFEIKNHTALINPPFSNCSDISRGWYISAGYSGISDDYDGGYYYDPSDGIGGNRYYHPTQFIQAHR